MTTAKEIYDFINGFAPFNTKMDFDNVGILIGDSSTASDMVIVSLDVTSEVIFEACRKNAKIIVTHHPVIFHPLKVLCSGEVPYLAAKNGITVISAHTNLDIARGGVNDTLAECAGVVAEQYFDEECMLIGHLEEPTYSMAFAAELKNNLNISGLRFTDVCPKIYKVAVSCGAGGNNIFLAAQYGVDAFVTGEIKHHEILFANEHEISVFDLGHFNSEDIIVPKLVASLSNFFPDTIFRKSETFSDKLIYLN